MANKSKVGRSYKAIRREKGKSDVVTVFPYTANPVDAVRWCESEDFEVIGHEIIETPNDEKHISTIIVTVQSRKRKNMKRKIGDLVAYGAEHYKVAGLNEDTQQYCLEPQDADVIQQIADQIWVDAKDID